MSNISFDNPWLLFIALPLFAAVLVPFFITVKKDNANFHNIASVSLHILLCSCLTLAIAGMSFETVITETNVYVLADISYSAGHNLDDVQSCVQKIEGKLPKNSKMGVICFGRNYELISDLGDAVPNVKSAKNVDRSATDIGSALRYAGNLFDDGVIKRIIVVTDGAETVSSNNLVKVVSALQEREIYVDAVFIDSNIDDNIKEVQLDGVDLNESTYLGKEEQADALIRVNCGANEQIQGYVSLYKDGDLAQTKTVSLYNGLNAVSLDLSTEEAGVFNYEVRVRTDDPKNDTNEYNNSYLFAQRVSGERKVLFIGGTAADAEAGRKIYGSDDVTYITNLEQVPISVEEMCGYDEIALSNFDVRKVAASNAFMTSLTSLVDDYGKSLATYGDMFIYDDDPNEENSLLKRLQALMPVRIGNFDQEGRLMTLVLDISGSMNFGGKFEIARRSCEAILQKLNAKDTVMIIGATGKFKEIIQPTKLTAKKVIIDTVLGQDTDNETNLSAALNYTYEKIKKERFHEKQVIILTDGLTDRTDSNAAKNAIYQMSGSNIIVSGLGIFPTDSDSAELERIIINENAAVKEGAFYKAITNERQVDLTLKDITDETSQVKTEGESYAAEIKKADDKAVEGVEALPAVNGFWYNAAKSTAKTVITAKYFRDKVTSFDVPIYAHWTCGRGKVSSFLSDITSGWAADWLTDAQSNAFLRNIPDATLPDVRINTPFMTEVEGKGNSTTLNVSVSATLKNVSDFQATVTDPDGLVETKQLSYDSSKYFAVFQTDKPGTYQVHLSYTSANAHYEADTQFSVSYFAEYDSFFGFNKAYLYRLLSDNGKILDLDSTKTLENSDSAYTSYMFSFTMPLMIACAVILIADIIIRQLKWKDVTSFFSGLFARRRK